MDGIFYDEARAATAMGPYNERRVLDATLAARGWWPPWLRGVRAATPEEDQRGWDVVADTDHGEVGVQVKSSSGHVAEFQRRHPGVVVVVVSRDISSEVVVDRLLCGVRKAYRIVAARQCSRAQNGEREP
jgi:hypothetical protein